MSARILLVEDEPGLAMVVTDQLIAEGHIVDTAGDGGVGLELAQNGHYDLLILDLMLPKMSGLDICQTVRQQGFDGGILMLTARSQITDRVNGLRAGADDYLVKPFNPDELIARVEALLRRVFKANLTPVMRVEFGRNVVDFSTMEFARDNDPVSLTAKELDLLRFLINRRGEALSRELILQQVWKEQTYVTPRTVDVHIAWLRRKIEDNPSSPRHIITVRGEGYRFEK